MKVLGEVPDAGPTSMRSLSPGVPASTGHGVKDTGRKANSPFLSLSGVVPSGLSKYTPVAGSSKTCRSHAGNDEDVACDLLCTCLQLAVVQLLVATSSEGIAFSKTQSKVLSRPQAPDRRQDPLQQLV